MRSFALRYAPLASLTLLAAAAFSVHAIRQHQRFETGRDLAIFDQALWHYSRLEAPASTLVGLPNILGDHLHPILVLLAPFYALWSAPEMLLVAQSLLIAAAVFPIFLFARERVDTAAAYALCCAYLVFWGVQAAAGFEFHEVAFAPLLLAAAIHLASRESWLPLYATLMALVLVKENLAILTVFFGLYVALLGHRRRGAAIAAVALGYYTVATEVLIPHFAGGRDFRHWTFKDFGDDLPSAVLHVLTHPWRPFLVLFDDAQKAETLAFLFLPFLGLTLASRLAVLVIPLVAERMLSSNELFWGTDAHYSLVIAPVLVMGAAAGLSNIARWVPLHQRRQIAVPALAGVIFVLNIGASAFADGRQPFSTLLHPSYYSQPPWVGPIERALDNVPDDPAVSVATQDRLTPHLSQRVALVGVGRTYGQTDYMVANVVEPFGITSGNRTFRELGLTIASRASDYRPIFFEDGWIVLKLRRPGEAEEDDPLSGLPQGLYVRLARSSALWSEAARKLAARFQQCATDTRCQSTAASDFLHAGRALRPTLLETIQRAPRGCSSLTTYALRALDELQQATSNVRTGRGDALADLAARVERRDLPGVVLRPTVFCSSKQ